MTASEHLFPPSLWRIGWRYLLRHPWQSLLMVIGVTLGVAVVVAVDLANASAARGFDLSTQAVAGRATHQLSGGPLGIDEALYARLRREGLVAQAAPVVRAAVSSPQLGYRVMQLLGVDPYAEAPFRSYLGLADAGTPIADLTRLLTQPQTILLSQTLAAENGLALGDTITLTVAGRAAPVQIAGLLAPGDEFGRRALDGLLLTDIAVAQELTGQLGRLDSIDLILPNPGHTLAQDQAALAAALPPDVSLQTVQARAGAVSQMTSAFQVNLTALSLLALIVGMFLIYNTMTFAVVQRRPLFGALRCLGVTRREIFGLVLSEALLVGLFGSFLGLLLGVWLGQGTVRMVTQTINDLFFTLSVRGVAIPLESLVKGGGMGLLATLLTAAPPAWEAASVPPRAALYRSGLESKARQAVTLAAQGGLLLLLVGIGVLFIPTRSLVVSFAGTFAVVIALALLAPWASQRLLTLLTPPFSRLGVLGRMAPRSVAASLSRTAIAVAALMVAVSVTIGVSVMVGSFRRTVVAWLGETLQGDLYITAVGVTGSGPLPPLTPGEVATLQAWPDVARVDLLRTATVDSPLGPIDLQATDNATLAEERLFAALDLPRAQVWNALQSGAILISEPLANRLNLAPGDTLTLETPSGPQPFPIRGVFYDYGSTQGAVLLSLDVYARAWEDNTISAASLRLRPAVDADSTRRALEQTFGVNRPLVVTLNRALRDEALAVFDRTFAITQALQILATVVAFVGILSALLSLELERQRELGILRAIGLTVGQLTRLLLLETGLLGFLAGILAMPTGYALALILVYIINRRSFGWTLQMQLTPEPFVQALLVAVGAALLAGVYPALRMARLHPSEALRGE
jgi:putative ABC transport system permease protein